METKELTCCDIMIGDWVEVNGKYIQVENVYKDMINYTPDIPYAQEEDFIDGKDITPIPLTAEILEKNGFSELMKHDEWSQIFRAYHDDLFIEVGIYEPMFINIGYVDNEGEEQPLSDIVKVHGENFFVHEIQHALRLCGVDKEITL